LREVNDATGRSWEPELRRQRAEILLALDPAKTAEAEADLKNAIELARRQNSRSLQLRAAVSLAKLWRGQQRDDQARELLQPIYRQFAEGSATADLLSARDLLAVLH